MIMAYTRKEAERLMSLMEAEKLKQTCDRRRDDAISNMLIPKAPISQIQYQESNPYSIITDDFKVVLLHEVKRVIAEAFQTFGETNAKPDLAVESIIEPVLSASHTPIVLEQEEDRAIDTTKESLNLSPRQNVEHLVGELSQEVFVESMSQADFLLPKEYQEDSSMLIKSSNHVELSSSELVLPSTGKDGIEALTKTVENPPRCSYVTSVSYPRPTKPPDPQDFPKFDGTRLSEWFRRCDEFFWLYNTPPESMTRIASLHMLGKAFYWNRNYIRNHYGMFPPWFDFVVAVSAEFGGLNDDSRNKRGSIYDRGFNCFQGSTKTSFASNESFNDGNRNTYAISENIDEEYNRFKETCEEVMSTETSKVVEENVTNSEDDSHEKEEHSETFVGATEVEDRENIANDVQSEDIIIFVENSPIDTLVLSMKPMISEEELNPENERVQNKVSYQIVKFPSEMQDMLNENMGDLQMMKEDAGFREKKSIGSAIRSMCYGGHKLGGSSGWITIISDVEMENHIVLLELQCLLEFTKSRTIATYRRFKQYHVYHDFKEDCTMVELRGTHEMSKSSLDIEISQMRLKWRVTTNTQHHVQQGKKMRKSWMFKYKQMVLEHIMIVGTNVDMRMCLYQTEPNLMQIVVITSKDIQSSFGSRESVYDEHRQNVQPIGNNFWLWNLKVRKEKASYHILNMFILDVAKKCLVDEGWNSIFASKEKIAGKIKAWLHDDLDSSLVYDVVGNFLTRTVYNNDGTRSFSCGTNKEHESFLFEWKSASSRPTYMGTLATLLLPISSFSSLRTKTLSTGEYCDRNHNHLV